MHYVGLPPSLPPPCLSVYLPACSPALSASARVPACLRGSLPANLLYLPILPAMMQSGTPARTFCLLVEHACLSTLQAVWVSANLAVPILLFVSACLLDCLLVCLPAYLPSQLSVYMCAWALF